MDKITNKPNVAIHVALIFQQVIVTGEDTVEIKKHLCDVTYNDRDGITPFIDSVASACLEYFDTIIITKHPELPFNESQDSKPDQSNLQGLQTTQESQGSLSEGES